MTAIFDAKRLRSQIFQAHLGIRVADIGQYIHAFFGEPNNRRHRKALRRKVLPILNSLVDEGHLTRRRTVRPARSANAYVVADEPFFKWSPAQPIPPLRLLTADGNQYLLSKTCLGDLESPYEPSHIGNVNIRTVVNSPKACDASVWITPYVTSTDALKTYLNCNVPLPFFLSLGERSRRRIPPDAAHPRAGLIQAELCVDHHLMVTAMYLHFLTTQPAWSETWTGKAVFSCPEELGRVPDAVLFRDGRPVLALSYAGPLTDLPSLHEYCAARSLPYELWGHQRAKTWYNPMCNHKAVRRIRVTAFKEIGPCDCLPAFSHISWADLHRLE